MVLNPGVIDETGGRPNRTRQRPPYTEISNPTPVADKNKDDNCQKVVRVEGLDSATVVGITFAAFVIGVLLTGALWYIHTHTGNIYTI